MVFGPNMQNFAAIATAFVQGGGAVQVRHASELETVFGELLASPARRDELGRRAIEVVRANSGALDRTADMIVRQIPPDENYVARGG
jgi:3-deoxy-D-manno-octulosonic-acid transferase